MVKLLAWVLLSGVALALGWWLSTMRGTPTSVRRLKLNFRHGTGVIAAAILAVGLIFGSWGSAVLQRVSPVHGAAAPIAGLFAMFLAAVTVSIYILALTGLNAAPHAQKRSYRNNDAWTTMPGTVAHFSRRSGTVWSGRPGQVMRLGA